jgi:hypothetical protein
MDEQTQEQFIQWLAQQLGVQSQEELEAAIEEMGEEGIQQAMEMFMQEMQGGGAQGGASAQQGPPQAAAYLNGGKLEYMRQLKAFKKGGKIKDKGKDSKTALNITKFSNKKDGKTAAKKDNRKEAPKQYVSAVSKSK